ncbi:PEP-CTERM sorting domain-containing protein [Candidatus Poribacteria bacterium]|nr:PEP-CTERM sorting domain-containing protein [Candidatus Poribacteria bacterium]
MTPNRCKLSLIMLVLASGMSLTTHTLAAPIVPGFTVTPYATVPVPAILSFDPSGVLYVGLDDNAPSGAKIRRVGVGGSPVVEYGASGRFDPDTVLFDAVGAISGTPGTVLVGGYTSDAFTSGLISMIRPDQSVANLFGPTATFFNPSDMTFDGTGRFLFTDSDARKRSVFVSTGGFPSTLFTLPGTARPFAVAIDAANRIFTSADDGTLRIHDTAGNLVNGSFATGLGTIPGLAFGTGAAFGTDLYAIDFSSGNLLRFDMFGNATVFGQGFTSGEDLAFGPDGALYVSERNTNRILRITPAAVIPEPGTLTLLGIGILGIIVLGWRRRKRAS